MALAVAVQAHGLIDGQHATSDLPVKQSPLR